jgi:hypothetical protein
LRQLLELLAEGKSLADENKASHALRFDKDYAWLRIKGPGEYTPAHSDWYFLNDPNETEMFDPPSPPPPISCAVCRGVNKCFNSLQSGSSSSSTSTATNTYFNSLQSGSSSSSTSSSSSSTYSQKNCDNNIDNINISIRRITGVEMASPNKKKAKVQGSSTENDEVESKEGLEQCGE